MKSRLSVGLAFAVVSIILVLGLTEGLARIYVYGVAKQGKLFEPDAKLGWRVLPHLDLERANADAESWRIVTDGRGMRGPSTWNEGDARRILVLGDSYAFGEGVDIEERFDSLIARRRPHWSFMNLGVMGYGSDQQVISARPFLSSMRRGDAILVLTFSNDFFDVLRRSFSGRAKPFFEIQGGRLVEFPPKVGWLEIIRDRSYIAARLGALLETRRELAVEDTAALKRGVTLHRAIIREASELWAEQGLRILLVYHGAGMLGSPAASVSTRLAFNRGCRTLPASCIDLEDAISWDDHKEYFLGDGHWNQEGHEAVARRLSVGLSRALER